MNSTLDSNLTFLKLGGSLITDKDQTETVRFDVLHALLQEVSSFLQANPQQRIVLGHGSGSFGHHAAVNYDTQKGVRGSRQWLGYQEVWFSARKLNQLVLTEANAVQLPVISFPPSACVVSENHSITQWTLDPLITALEKNLVPLVYGDVVVDTEIGGTILSTEELFAYLARTLHPSRILLAGIDNGVFEDFPSNNQIIELIEADSENHTTFSGSQSIDVTGGMRSKVEAMQNLCRQVPGTRVQIFSGLNPKNLAEALAGSTIGTTIL